MMVVSELLVEGLLRGRVVDGLVWGDAVSDGGGLEGMMVGVDVLGMAGPGLGVGVLVGLYEGGVGEVVVEEVLGEGLLMWAVGRPWVALVVGVAQPRDTHPGQERIARASPEPSRRMRERVPPADRRRHYRPAGPDDRQPARKRIGYSRR